MDILEEIRILKQNNVKYENIKEKNQKIIDTINKVIDELVSLKKEIDPISTVKSSTKHNIDYNSYIDEFFDLMKNGTTINSELIKKAYPDLLPWQVFWIMDKLRNIKGVKSSKIGRSINLFVIEEI